MLYANGRGILGVFSARRVNYTALFLLLLSAAALLIHGYHPYAEDAEIYLPGIERLLNPGLFPVGQEFFQSHAHMTLFPNLVAVSLRATHIPFEAGLFVWHISSIFLLLLACWELSGVLFSGAKARWGAVCVIAALLTIPVAETALYIVDQYLNPRNLAAFAAVFAVARILEKKYLRALAWIAFAACMHPLMWVFPFSFGALWIIMELLEQHASAVKKALAPVIPLSCLVLIAYPWAVLSPAYHETAKLHGYFYIQEWTWVGWLGMAAPLILLWWFARTNAGQRSPMLARACRAFAAYGLIYFIVALALDLPSSLESAARLQPLRSLHLLYIFFFVCAGGLLGEYVLKNRTWRWVALFVPLSLGMFAAQRSLFPASAHIELPGRAPSNPWAEAFVWVRENTPKDALFALDPEHMRVSGEDAIGFRSLAQRSRLADLVKDGGVASMFPPLAHEWWEQVQAQDPWEKLRKQDFARLRDEYGVSWIVMQQPAAQGLDCEYQNAAVRVCRIQRVIVSGTQELKTSSLSIR